MSQEDREEIAYLEQALKVLQDSLARDQDPVQQSHLRKYISDIQGRIDEKKSNA